MTMTPISTMPTTIGTVPSCVYILCSLVANAGMAITGFGSALLFILVYTLCEMCGLLTAAACTPAEICSMKYAVFFQALSLLGSTPYLVYKARTRSSRRRTTRRTAEEEEKNAGVITQKLLCTLLPATLVATPCGQWFQEKGTNRCIVLRRDSTRLHVLRITELITSRLRFLLFVSFFFFLARSLAVSYCFLFSFYGVSTQFVDPDPLRYRDHNDDGL